MTTVDQRPATLLDNDVYDSDDALARNSPPLKQMKVSYQPDPSPPPIVPLPAVSPDSSPDPEDRKPGRPKYKPSQGDAVLVSFMAGGKHHDIARVAGDKPLASDNEESEESIKGADIEVMVVEEAEEAEGERVKVKDEPLATTSNFDLAALAAGALGMTDALKRSENRVSEPATQKVELRAIAPRMDAPPATRDSIEGLKQKIPPLSSLYMNAPGGHASPTDPGTKFDMATSPVTGELPPIRHSPKSLSNGNTPSNITLPSISAQLGDINRLPDPMSGDSPFPQSPQARPPLRFNPVPSHASPPKSPNETFRRELPSPAFYNSNTMRRPSQADNHQYSSAGDYNSSNTETPSTDNSSTPAMAIDRMSIDGITNPQIGGFQCTYAGCTAQPFQTQVSILNFVVLYSTNVLQYLLNSHANVHSSNRPHYCSVKGCPRSEGGKGFKRKNEMIRHGLVHDSPGYVCPFCPDREHKYPRPDNLQR